MSWTEERVETLAKLWREGKSAAQIAKELGDVSRNAVIGKVHRMGLSGRAAPHLSGKNTAPRTRVVRVPAARKVKPKKPAPVEPVKPVVFVPANPQTIIEISPGECRYPVSGQGADMLFCADKAEDGTSWCKHHGNVVSGKGKSNKELSEARRKYQTYLKKSNARRAGGAV